MLDKVIETDAAEPEYLEDPTNWPQVDPQRHVNTDFLMRAGPTGHLVVSKKGDIDSNREGETGFYVGDMRVCSKFSVSINGREVTAEKGYKDDASTFFEFQLKGLPPEIQGELSYTLSGTTIVTKLRLANRGSTIAPINVALAMEADHEEIFNVRFPDSNHPRGKLHNARQEEHGLTIQYDRLELEHAPEKGWSMETSCKTSEKPAHNEDGTLGFTKALPPGNVWEIVTKVETTCIDNQLLNDSAPPVIRAFDATRAELLAERSAVYANAARIKSENKQLEKWLHQAQLDLSLLTAKLDTGFYTFAGQPWYLAPFGRDGIITSLQSTLINPIISEGAIAHHIKYMAPNGQCMHEARFGDVCGAGILPFTQYYGGVDTTLLHVMNAYGSWYRTGDDAKMQNAWPSVKRALQWAGNHGDLKKDGFIRYLSDAANGGLANQGWKDSEVSIMHANGELAVGEIALCEVQGYAYAAWRAGEAMARAVGENALAAMYRSKADELYKRFNELFWQDDLGIYALALDGNDEPCRVKASNMAHLGMCGIVPDERKQSVIDVLKSKEMYSGWGLRTLAEGEALYDPRNYHDGPVWPHEMYFAMLACQDAGDHDFMRTIAADALSLAVASEFHVPELICGYPKVDGRPYVKYPSADPIHSWSAGIAPGIVCAALGLKIDARNHEVTVNPSGLPREWAPITVENLQVGNGTISFAVDKNLQARVVEQTGSYISFTDERKSASRSSPRWTPGVLRAG